MNYLEFYYDCMESGELPGQNGLCDELGKKRLSLFKPTKAEIDTLNLPSTAYWASDYAFSFGAYTECESAFGPTRQNIVLLLAAINGQL